MKNLDTRLSKVERYLADLDEEIYALLVQLYGTNNSNPALLHDLQMLSPLRAMSDDELISHIREEYAHLTQEKTLCG